MKNIIKIGIQDDGFPVWMEGEISNSELDRLKKLIDTMAGNRIKEIIIKGLEKEIKKGKGVNHVQRI